MSGSIKLPSTLELIGSYSFENCGLTSVIIPSNVINIGSQAFANNPNLSTITVKRASSDGMTLGSNWNGTATVVYDPS